MKFISWNVNGIRACLNKGLADFLSKEQPDVLCLQETKARVEQVELPLEFGGYYHYWNSAEKAGYSGVAIFSKTEPLSVLFGMGIDEHDHEGRVLTAEYQDFYLVTVYTPNSKSGLTRLPYRQDWDEVFLAFCKELEQKKPVMICGDLNVAHAEIDLARPSANHFSVVATKTTNMVNCAVKIIHLLNGDFQV